MKQIFKKKEPPSLTKYRASISKKDLRTKKKYEDSPKFETSNLKRIIRQYQNKNSKGKYRPYCEMIVYFLTKKLKSKGIVLK